VRKTRGGQQKENKAGNRVREEEVII